MRIRNQLHPDAQARQQMLAEIHVNKKSAAKPPRRSSTGLKKQKT